MANPTPYTPGYSYSNFQASQPTKPLPAPQVDNDFANIATSIDETIEALKDIRRSDGKLANQTVGPDQISPGLSIGFTNRGLWQAGRLYETADGVAYDQKFYSALVQHTSSLASRPDQDDGSWQFLFNATEVTIPDESISGAKLMPGAVDTAQLADGAVTSVKIEDGAVGTSELADDSVTLEKTDGTFGRITFGTVDDLASGVVAGKTLAYADGASVRVVVPGQKVWAGQYCYEIADGGVGDADVTTDGGVKLYFRDTVPVFASVADAQANLPRPAPAALVLVGKADALDGLGGVYERVVSEPADVTRTVFAEGINLRTDGTAIGNMTSGGGLAAAFDNTFSKTAANCARGGSSITRFIGRSFSTARRVLGVYIHPSSDAGMLVSADTSVTVTLYGKTGSAPGSATGGTSIGSTTFGDQNSALSRWLPANDLSQWDHCWIAITGDGSNDVVVGQLHIVEADATPTIVTPDKFSVTLPGPATVWYKESNRSPGHGLAFGRTPHAAELIPVLPTFAENAHSTRRVVMRVPVYVEAGDLLRCKAAAEFSSNEGSSGANIGVWSFLGLCSAPGQVVVGNDYEITESSGRNITPSVHHDTHVHAGTIVAPATGLYYVSFIAWAASNAATTNVTVESDYGHVSVERVRGRKTGLLG